MRHKITFIFTFLMTVAPLCAQQVSGIVYDKKSQEPMEGVTIYFDGTTKGTITNINGVFKIDINKELQTSLVISFLGYKKLIHKDYSDDFVYKYYLEEEISVLNEIYLSDNKTSSRKTDALSSYENIWTRKQKMTEFKNHFLGVSKQAQSCKILNEDDIFLTYDKTSDKLIASSKKPIRILNKHLEYEIAYDLQDFEVQYVSHSTEGRVKTRYSPTTVYYAGTSFYKVLNNNPSNRIDKKRTKVYQGSVLHFMRAVYSNRLIDEGFKLFYEKQQVAPEHAIVVNETENPNLKEICFLKPELEVVDASDSCSKLKPIEDACFFVDNFGNHSPIKAITFTGFIGNQRIGDALPLDYEPEFELKQ